MDKIILCGLRLCLKVDAKLRGIVNRPVAVRLTTVLILMASVLVVEAADPVVSKVRVSHRPGTHKGTYATTWRMRMAMRYGSKWRCRIMVECGPSVPDISVHNAATDGSIEAVKQHLAAGTDVNAMGDEGETPLHPAATFGYKNTAALLISKGADVNAKGDRRGWTPLHIAAGEGHKEIAELLIAKGADVNAKEDYGETPIDFATHPDNPNASAETADLLRKHGGKTREELKAEGK